MTQDLEADLGPTASEFEDAYGEERDSTDVFSAELLLQTLEVLAPKTPVCASPSNLVSDAIDGMRQRNQGCLLVTEDDVLVGIFTERDVLRRVVGIVDPKTTELRSVMTRSPEAVSFHDTLAAAMNKMTVGGYRHVPLVDIRHRPVGIVSVKDIVTYIVGHFPRYVLTVAPDPTNRNPDQLVGG